MVKVSHKNGEEHEYKRQPRYSADEASSLQVSHMILVRLKKSREKLQKQ